MSKSSRSSSSSGIGFTGLLTIIFIVLKLTGYINWSWWWVLAPSWMSLAICLLFLAVCGIVVILARD
jgi:hypothetical protein